MKKIAKQLGIYIVSLLIFYGGSGINIASFCCDNCQSEGVAGIAEETCCTIHSHESEDAGYAGTDANPGYDSSGTHCSLSRLLYDWNTSTSSTFKLDSNYFELAAICLPLELAASPQVEENITYECSAGPLVFTPQTYLSLLTTLLI